MSATDADHLIAHDAMTDVAKWLGFRDDRGENPERLAFDKYLLAQENDPKQLRALAVRRVAGQKSGLPKVRWRPSMLEGG